MTTTASLTAKEIAELLDEPNVFLIRRIIRCLGAPRAEAWLEETLALEAAGGMLVRDGSRRRTPGGVFFALVRQHVDAMETRWIFWSEQQRQTLREVFPRAPQAPILRFSDQRDRGGRRRETRPGHQHYVRPVIYVKRPRPAKPPPVTVEGTVLMTPIERHTNSVWRVLRTDGHQIMRVSIAKSCALADRMETGHRVRVVGPLVEKVWKDGPHPTLSAHESVEIIDMAATG